MAELNPGNDAAWSQPDGITDGTFAVAVYWPGVHLKSAVLHREGSGDWASWNANFYAWGIGVSATPNGPLVNASDSTFDIATNSKGRATFFIHVDDLPTPGYFGRLSQFQLTLCTEPDASNCLDGPIVTIR